MLDYLRLTAATGIWLSAAWLGRRLLSAAILSYSARTARGGGASLLVGGGSQLLIDIGGAIIFAAALLVIVAVVYQLPLGGLLATSGVVAAIIGFAIQRMISDVFSGLALNIEHPFAVGDWIETSSGVTGRVLDANWRAVHLVTIEGRAVVIPNSVLANNQFINLNAPHRHFRLKKTICLDYSVPSTRVVPIFQAAMEATDGVLTAPKPIVLIDECNDRGVLYSLNFWVPDYPNSFPISRQVVINALRFLDQDGLAPAYPKRDVAIAKAPTRQLLSRIDVPTVLGRVPLLRHLGSDALELLERRAHVHEYPDTRVLINEGDPGSSLFVVIAGLLEVSQRDASGRQRAVGASHCRRCLRRDLAADRSAAHGHGYHADAGDADRDRQAASSVALRRPPRHSRATDRYRSRPAAGQSQRAPHALGGAEDDRETRDGRISAAAYSPVLRQQK